MRQAQQVTRGARRESRPGNRDELIPRSHTLFLSQTRVERRNQAAKPGWREELEEETATVAAEEVEPAFGGKTSSSCSHTWRQVLDELPILSFLRSNLL